MLSLFGPSPETLEDSHYVLERFYQEVVRILGRLKKWPDSSQPELPSLPEALTGRAGRRLHRYFQKRGYRLLYRFPDSVLSYTQLLQAYGHGENWTVVNESGHRGQQNIAWRPVERGYWFFAEDMEECPRQGLYQTPDKYQQLARLADERYCGISLPPLVRAWLPHRKARRLLYLEEYAVLYYVCVSRNSYLDCETYSWLITTVNGGQSSTSLTGTGMSQQFYPHSQPYLQRTGARFLESVPV